MLLDNHYEDLSFLDSNIINTSRKIDEGYRDLTHWHPFTEILLSLREGNEVVLNFKSYELRPNDFIISFPGDLHCVKNVADDSFLIIQFPMELITVVPEFGKLQPLLYKAPYCCYDVGNLSHEKMTAVLKEIVYSDKKETGFRNAYNYSRLIRFFSLYGRYCLEAHADLSGDEGELRYRSSKLMAEACLYISQNCTEPLTLEDAAREVGISKSYFSHLFKDYTQMTFVEYLTRERIRRAEAMMFGGSGEKIIDIAFECGFTSISSFNRTFRKIKGISPREFRNAMVESVSDHPSRKPARAVIRG